MHLGLVKSQTPAGDAALCAWAKDQLAFAKLKMKCRWMCPDEIWSCYVEIYQLPKAECRKPKAESRNKKSPGIF